MIIERREKLMVAASAAMFVGILPAANIRQNPIAIKDAPCLSSHVQEYPKIGFLTLTTKQYLWEYSVFVFVRSHESNEGVTVVCLTH